MDKQTMVKYRIGRGQRFLDLFPYDEFEVTMAFWAKDNEGGWTFYLVSPLVDELGYSDAFLRLHPLMVRMAKPMPIQFLEIQLIGSGDLIAKSAASLLETLPETVSGPIPWEGGYLGRIPVEEAYFYSIPAHVA